MSPKPIASSSVPTLNVRASATVRNRVSARLQAGHVHVEGASVDSHRAVQAVQDDADQRLLGSDHPFGIEQRRREAFLAEAIGFVALNTRRGEDTLARVEAGLLNCGERGGRWRRGEAGLADPVNKVEDA